ENIFDQNNDLLRYFLLYFRDYEPTQVLNTRNIYKLKFPVKFINYLWLNFSIPDLSWFIKDIDIFHSPHFSLPVISKSKKILTVNDITYLKYPEYYSKKGKKLNDYGYKILLPTNLNRADHIITISQHTKSDIIEYFKLHDDKITTIHIGCNIPDKISQEKLSQIISRFGVSDRSYIYFPAGTFEPRKNIEKTITAFKKVSSQDHNLKLLISGVGDKSFLKGGLLQENILIVRWNTIEERNALYQSAKFIIYPSLYEGFGIPALEALANGKALLTSNISSLPEIAEDYAVLINPSNEDEIANGIELLLKDENLRLNLENKAVNRAKEFSYNNMATKTYNLYKRILA
ncbi:MAG TPA: glycosyltransferase family 1 protein, partial [Victivallales bacterium]|nr:glycosyltransferase family 1 protein [Victivallales bacterium]